jgi:hypothetical protein
VFLGDAQDPGPIALVKNKSVIVTAFEAKMRTGMTRMDWYLILSEKNGDERDVGGESW